MQVKVMKLFSIKIIFCLRLSTECFIKTLLQVSESFCEQFYFTLLILNLFWCSQKLLNDPMLIAIADTSTPAWGSRTGDGHTKVALKSQRRLDLTQSPSVFQFSSSKDIIFLQVWCGASSVFVWSRSQVNGAPVPYKQIRLVERDFALKRLALKCCFHYAD